MCHTRTPFVITVLLVGLIGCNRGPSVQSSITSGQKHFQPVLDALAQYFQKHNEYPVSLDDLVREGLLTEIPRTPVVSNASERDLWYRAANDRKSCKLVFSYHLKNQLGLGDTTYAEWHSETGQWKMSGPGY